MKAMERFDAAVKLHSMKMLSDNEMQDEKNRLRSALGFPTDCCMRGDEISNDERMRTALKRISECKYAAWNDVTFNHIIVTAEEALRGVK